MRRSSFLAVTTTTSLVANRNFISKPFEQQPERRRFFLSLPLFLAVIARAIAIDQSSETIWRDYSWKRENFVPANSSIQTNTNITSLESVCAFIASLCKSQCVSFIFPVSSFIRCIREWAHTHTYAPRLNVSISVEQWLQQQCTWYMMNKPLLRTR